MPHRWSVAGSPNFRCSPFARDVLLDPGRMAVPRISALLMLRSTISTVSAPATCLFRGSITNPTQLLCTLRGRRTVGSPQHFLPGGLLRPYLDRSFPGWTAPAFVGAFGNFSYYGYAPYDYAYNDYWPYGDDGYYGPYSNEYQGLACREWVNVRVLSHGHYHWRRELQRVCD
jgi:hypothetical protein